LLYQERLGEPKGEGFSASPVAVNAKVFFTNDDGETFVLQAGREFKLLHVNRLGEGTLASGVEASTCSVVAHRGM
jgi:hypothetical protein